MRFVLFVALFAAAGCASQPLLSSNPATCRAEMALYRLRGAPDATLRILEPPHALNSASDLAARVDFEGDVYWFAFTASLGYSRSYIGRTDDPFEAATREDSGLDQNDEHREPEFNGSELSLFDANYDLIEALPQKGAAAPAHLLANGVASSIWYSVPRRELPKGMWDFSECVDDLG